MKLLTLKQDIEALKASYREAPSFFPCKQCGFTVDVTADALEHEDGSYICARCRAKDHV